MFVKSTRFKQVRQLLLSLSVHVNLKIHPIESPPPNVLK